MKKIIFATCLLGLFAAQLHYAPNAEAENVTIMRRVLDSGINAAAGNVCHDTVVFGTNDIRSVTMFVTYVDNGGATCTDITMQCRSNLTPATATWANSYDMMGSQISCVAPWCNNQQYPALWHHTCPGAGLTTKYSITIDKAPSNAMICEFCTVGAVAADKITVNYISPETP